MTAYRAGGTEYLTPPPARARHQTPMRLMLPRAEHCRVCHCCSVHTCSSNTLLVALHPRSPALCIMACKHPSLHPISDLTAELCGIAFSLAGRLDTDWCVCRVVILKAYLVGGPREVTGEKPGY